MRKIQIERKLFELLGLKFFVFEKFQDADLNIDDKSIYQFDNENQLVDIFATKKLFTIWSDERRLNAGVICACEGNLSSLISYLQKIGIKDEAYSTSNCMLGGEPIVLYLSSQEAMSALMAKLTSVVKKEKVIAAPSFMLKTS